jgi:hypothetical protein
VLGKENCFGAVKGKVQPGPMTFFRASTDDRLGTIKAYVGDGEFTADPFGMDGGLAVTKVARLRPLLGFIARNGSNLEADLTILESDPYKTDPKIMAIKVGETWVAGEKKCG